MSNTSGRTKLVSDKSLYVKTVLRGHDIALDRLLRTYDNQLTNYCNDLEHEMYFIETYNEEILPRCQKMPERNLRNNRTKICKKYLKQKLLDDYRKSEKVKSEGLHQICKNA